MDWKQFRLRIRALTKIAARNLKSPEAAQQFLRSMEVVLGDQLKNKKEQASSTSETTRMSVFLTTSPDGWMIIASGKWE